MEGEFATSNMEFPFDAAPLVEKAMAQAPPPFFDVPLAPLPPLANDIAKQLISDGYTHAVVPLVSYPVGQHGYDFQNSRAPKLRIQNYCNERCEDVMIASIVHFSPSAAGPPGRANGGAILAAFGEAFDACIVRLKQSRQVDSPTYVCVRIVTN
jgi:hypothetical protein